MAPLLEMFPNLQTKETLAPEEEFAPFKNYSSRMAAIDYTVCLHSEVFVTTQEKRNLLRLRIILPGWLQLITLFFFIVRCLSQLKKVALGAILLL
ncbi:hypothetical protein K1719_044059 [Acacia pycnantha]|nr:hypothetical protein K1719_044059 [Acacia pycnantha]